MKFLALFLAGLMALTMPTTAQSQLLNSKTVLTIDPERTIVIRGEVDGNAMAAAVRVLDMAAASTDDIYMVINSPGGNVITGMQLVQAMQIAESRGISIRCVVPNLAASMAFVIFSACTDRYAFNSSLLLWHPMRTGSERGFTEGEARAAAEQMHRLSRPLMVLQREALGISWELFMKHYRLETLWTALGLSAVAPDFLTLIDDVEGVQNIFNP